MVVPEEALASLREVSRERWLARTRWRRRRPLVLTGLAAAAALLLALVLLPRLLSRADGDLTLASLVATSGVVLTGDSGVESSLSPGVSLHPRDGLRTADGRAALGLAEGGSLRLDRRTRLRLLGPARVDLEAGAVYFDSAGRRAGAPPLELRTPVGTVVDVGTRFEARVDEAGGLQVRVREGSVQVDGDGVEEVVEAGEVVEVTVAGGVSRGDVEPWDPAFEWIHEAAPTFEIEGRRLEAFLAWAVREGGWTVELGDDAARRAVSETVLHGSVSGLAPRAALDLVLPGAGLAYVLEDGTLSVHGDGSR